MRKDYKKFLANIRGGVCPLCFPFEFGNKIIKKFTKMYLIENKFSYPGAKKHYLVCTKHHKSKYTELNQNEIFQMNSLIDFVRRENKGTMQMLLNDGGDSVKEHFHLHIIFTDEDNKLRWVTNNQIA